MANTIDEEVLFLDSKLSHYRRINFEAHFKHTPAIICLF